MSSLVFHLLSSAPCAGEATRGYFHGHLIIDFVGQAGPTSKYRLVPLDLIVIFLQLLFLSGLIAKKKVARSGSSLGQRHVDHQDSVDVESLEAEERSFIDLEHMGSQQLTGQPSPHFNSNEGRMQDLLFSGQFSIWTFWLIESNLIQNLQLSERPLKVASAVLNNQISADLRQSRRNH
jgi:hypothetical protein